MRKTSRNDTSHILGSQIWGEVKTEQLSPEDRAKYDNIKPSKRDTYDRVKKESRYKLQGR